MCLLQGSCPKFSRIKIREGARNVVKGNALPIHCDSRESSGGNEMQKSCLDVFLLLSHHSLPKVPTHSHMHICTKACMRSSSTATQVYPHTPQTLKYTYMCMYFKCIHINTNIPFNIHGCMCFKHIHTDAHTCTSHKHTSTCLYS